MASYNKKTWTDRDAEYLNRRSLTNVETGETDIVDVGLAEGDIYTEGSPLSASEMNDLEQRIDNAFSAIPAPVEVEVTPVVTEGDTLATIRVNETSTEIKMPLPFVVNYNGTTIDKTYNEILAAIDEGREVQLHDLAGSVYELLGFLNFQSRSEICFVELDNTIYTHGEQALRLSYMLVKPDNSVESNQIQVPDLPVPNNQRFAGQILAVHPLGTRYMLTTNNTILDTSTSTNRTWSARKINTELQARDTEIAAKANTSDVNAALELKADKADTYTKTQVDTALSAKANTADVTASLALKADKADTYTKTEVDTALDNKADKATTYTKSEVDTALAAKANTTDLSAVATSGDYDDLLNKPTIPTATSQLTNDSDYQTGEQVSQAVENKADTDGTYEDMTVGTAMKLVATRHTTDIAPYLFRQSGGDNNAYVGTEETDKLVGASAVVNQLIDKSKFINVNRGDYTVVNNDDGSLTVTIINTLESNVSVLLTANATPSYVKLPRNHRYILFDNNILPNGVGYQNGYNGVIVGVNVIKTQTAANDYFLMSLILPSGLTAQTFTIKPNIIDLTAMFGTTIADYVYSLEQATAGSGIAYLRKYGFFTKDYYPYTANTLQSVNTSKHITTGANLLNPALVQSLDSDGNGTMRNGLIISKSGTYTIQSFVEGRVDYIYARVIRNGIYGNAIYVKAGSTSNIAHITISVGEYFILYDAYAGHTIDYSKGILGLTQIQMGSTATAYEPYSAHEYALPNIDLRGLYKLDASNNLYADGDTLEGDGTLTRKYGIVDLGTLNWTFYVYGSINGGYTDALENLIKRTSGVGVMGNYISNGLIQVVDSQHNMSGDNTFSVTINGRVKVHKSEATDNASLKSALSGIYLIYELKTPTTETATGFTNPQSVDRYGTEEYTDTRDFPLPVGHETDYLLDSEMPLPVPPVTAGTYNLQLTVDASGNQTYSWAT